VSLWWAAEPANPPVWQTWLPTLLGVIITAAGGAVGTVLVKRLNRRLDDATADKTGAESRKADAETVSIEVATARGLISDIKTMMSEQREQYEGQIALARGQSEAQIEAVRLQHQADMKAMTERMSGIEGAFARHRAWDDQATAILRQTDGSFPDPPPVRFD
jgi:hypothetical protein